MDKETLQFMFKDINNRLRYLNEWEIEFISNVEDRFLGGAQLTKRQTETVNKIYEKATENG
jgi:hypothetical protein